MTKDQLTIVLERLTGQLQPVITRGQDQLDEVRRKLAGAVLREQADDVGSEQLFANSDLHSRERIQSSQLERLASIAAEAVERHTPEDPEQEPDQFFIRSTPVLNPQVAGSLPDWALGAKPSVSYGPFLNGEGREVWFDFYRVEKLITLYVGNQPILMFRALFRSPRLLILGAPPIELTTTYNLVAGSCWIHAPLFAAGAPASGFVGVQIGGGTITLTEMPVISNNRLSINAAVQVSVKLQLVQGIDAGAGNSSAYGKDARSAKYHLPETWDFSIRNNKASVQHLAPSSATVFGQALDFRFNPAANPVNRYLNGYLLIPWETGQNSFQISSSESKWAPPAGQSDIKESFWALPSAALNISSPVVAHGNGAVWLNLSDGLSLSWTGLQNDEARFTKAVLLAGPGAITLTDTECNISGASQTLALWKDKLNRFGSDVRLNYRNKSPFLYTSLSELAIELISTTARADINADRPVKVDTECFKIKTARAGVGLSASSEKRQVFVYGEDLLNPDSSAMAIHAVQPVIPREAIALENGLFTVSPVAAFILFGEAGEDWTKLSRANLFLSFHLFSYLPALPDPYIANLQLWRRLFEGRGLDRMGLEQSMMLIGTVRFAPTNGEADDVRTSFHFGGQTTPGLTDLLEEAGEDLFKRPTPTPGGKTGSSGTVKKKRTPDRQAEPVRVSRDRNTTDIKPVTAGFGLMKNKSSLNIKEMLAEITEATVFIPETTIAASSPVFTPPMLNGFLDGQGKARSYEELRKLGLDTETMYDDALGLGNEFFSLLDVSSNANQLGVSFGPELFMIRTGSVRRGTDDQFRIAQSGTDIFPFLVEGMQVKVPGNRVRLFTLPLHAWEPEINTSPPDTDNPNVPGSPTLMMDPQAGPLYYANDGGPSRFWNNNGQPVPLAPIPAAKSLVEKFRLQPDNYTLAAVTLPFGMKAITYLSRSFEETIDPSIQNLRPLFREEEGGGHKFEGGIQISLQAGNYGNKGPTPAQHDSPTFPGYVFQLNNLLDLAGQPSYASNLGHRVTQIFNHEFFIAPLKDPQLKNSRGVPVSRMDITGYGANMFSNWLSPMAAMAQTSQARFDVMMGRTGHEVVQVRSILYPWGIRVVRTITIFRAPSGYVYRHDSGWKAESDGLFDFGFRVLKEGVDRYADNLNDSHFTDIHPPHYPSSPLYQFHPGMIRGLFNVRNIKDTASVAEFSTTLPVAKDELYINGVKGQIMKSGTAFVEDIICGPVYFDADVEIENVVQGSINGTVTVDLGSGKKARYGRVVSKKVLGYVQVAPAGKPLTAAQLRDLLNFQNGSIGGSIDCEVNINGSDQQMHLSRFDVSASVAASGNTPVFVVAARGQVYLPKDGSWALVQHDAGSGVVTQLPNNTSVPLIRTGLLKPGIVIDPEIARKSLARIAHPLEVLRAAGNTAINFGFLQTTGTQKALFLTPAYTVDEKILLSKTPPIFADAYRLMTGNSIFPNIGNAIDNFGSAMPLLNAVNNAGNEVKAFTETVFDDGGTKALKLMDILSKKAGETVIEQGMKLAQQRVGDALSKGLEFAIPQLSEPIYLVKTEAVKIYIEYKAKPKGQGDKKGKLDFDIDSFTGELENQWRSRMNNISMVVDLSDMKRVMIIKGNFDSKKGKESNYEGGPDAGSDLPTPEIEFGPDLKPITDLLEVLGSLSTGDYAGTMKKGLKIAMSNSGEIWEYKFEASKELPTIRFPPTDEAYYSAQTPLKLEASMGVGVYFNAALKVTTDTSQLLPTAGAFLTFRGGLSVMCVSVGVASIYAVGTIDVKLSADTKTGPGLTLKFGFGVAIVVSLPVIGNVSVTYMVGIEMHADSQTLIVAVMLRFQGRASLAAGMVCVTITIEAKGIMERTGGDTLCTAQCTFALDISIFMVIDISFSRTWSETRQIA